jgi:peptidyl-prolyl isomerase E (cyclophilin E)
MSAVAETTALGIPDASVLASKRVIYVGGLSDEATIQVVRAATIPFGEIKSVDMPLDYSTGKHRGFCFVEYRDAEDAQEALFNLDGSQLLGRFIKVSLAQANQVNKLSSSSDPIWKSDEWFQQNTGVPQASDVAEQQAKELDVKTLQ